ncbi:LLM class flavin-dependent oxidoreductase [Streptosporangium sp. NPDC000563]|uniref:LLM class flavin-dependent oxidoreductase n=1 Tax=Streptosporangium sp. NPDC000563 TaxID=3154366 RepID=UPI0033191C85
MEIWQVNFPIPGRTGRMAKRAEDAGWDGLAFGDTQCLTGDVFVGMALAAEATERLLVAPGISNPVTRHPSVMAAAVQSVHEASGGRAVLGIGRGDSSLTYINRKPAKLADFGKYVRQVRGYLRDEIVDLDGFESRSEWIGRSTLPPVRVDVAASGPKAIAMAAREADGIMFALGADPERIAAAIAWARQSRAEAGKDPADLTFGAYINVMTGYDVEAARSMLAGAVLTIARFSATARFATEDPALQEQYRRAAEAYDRIHHASSVSGHGTVLEPEFIDRFAVAGPPQACVDRLQALKAAGLDRVVVLMGARDGDREVVNAGLKLFTEKVLPNAR